MAIISAFPAGKKIDVDSAISSSSSNPVENQAIYTALQGKQDTLTFDNTPTSGSNNPVKSSGIKTALDTKATLSITTTDPGEGSTLAAGTLLVVVEE